MKANKLKKYSMADLADRHHLYELSVQNAESEIDFVDETFTQLRGRKAQLLREDFCGTANVCCEWVTRRKDNIAIGVDLDSEVLQWSRDHRLPALKKKQAQRISLLERNVLDAETPPADIISAMNFSYWLLKEPAQLREYFSRAREALKDDGILFLDAYGGYDAFREIEEDREVEDEENGTTFTYYWEQTKFDPLTNQLNCSIHFEFEDGSLLKDAFVYEWRLWTLPEIKQLLLEAGFTKVTFYWQGFDEDGEGDGEFQPVQPGEVDADAGWICYITAEKN
ncbi:MAG: class I SAM-dependent methyltransferase [Chromatiales bacterium]